MHCKKIWHQCKSWLIVCLWYPLAFTICCLMLVINEAYPFDVFGQLLCHFHIAFSSCKHLPEWARRTLLTFAFPGSGWSNLELISELAATCAGPTPGSSRLLQWPSHYPPWIVYSEHNQETILTPFLLEFLLVHHHHIMFPFSANRFDNICL